MTGDGWRITTRVENGQEVELLEVDGVEYLHHAGSSREEIEARVEQIRWDHLADQLDQHGNPEGAARIRAGEHPYQQEGTQQEGRTA